MKRDVAEYLSLDLRGVTPGSYLLRLRVGHPGSEETVETNRAIRVR